MHQATSQVSETELAVFARNHERHLQEASQATSRDHTPLRTFRSPAESGDTILIIFLSQSMDLNHFVKLVEKLIRCGLSLRKAGRSLKRAS